MTPCEFEQDVARDLGCRAGEAWFLFRMAVVEEVVADQRNLPTGVRMPGEAEIAFNIGRNVVTFDRVDIASGDEDFPEAEELDG